MWKGEWKAIGPLIGWPVLGSLAAALAVLWFGNCQERVVADRHTRLGDVDQKPALLAPRRP